ncbi:RcnB family protein [Novosphingobium aquiterrae]|uniref:RcnB family protein n=1 Tax=Novosphingobium aquiterrae TaxID=624388 RepID=A0ABV6PL40_9SPHN
MKKIIAAALAASVLVPAAASAQSAQEVRNGQREVRHDRAEVQRHARNGDYRNANAARQELREDQRELREDWRDYRRSNQQAFRQGRYEAPRGYRYAPVRFGVNLRSGFYSSRYWIADPYRYRLPNAQAGTRWVRYGNDVLLVNVRSGRVLRVYSNFFY